MNNHVEQPLNTWQRFARKVVVQARTSFLIPIFWRLYDSTKTQAQMQYLQSLPTGTLGRGVADCLTANGLKLIPHYEDHDLKHVLLGYEMTPEDELKLKAFTLGNGDYSITCIGFLLFGLLTPEIWPELAKHYQKGRRVQKVYNWSLQEYATEEVEALRQRIGYYAA